VKRASQDEIAEREATVLLADFATVWNERCPPNKRESSSSWSSGSM
jgi:hypothetical protein